MREFQKGRGVFVSVRSVFSGEGVFHRIVSSMLLQEITHLVMALGVWMGSQ